jgi:hypothetical protein
LVFDESTPEENTALKVVEQVAQSFAIDTPAVYVLPDEVGVNALTAGFQISRYRNYFNVGCITKFG